MIAALSGAAIPSSGIVPAGLLGHFTDLPNYSYDPAKAKPLLNQAGYGPGKKKLDLSLTYTQGDTNEQVVATLMKSDLAKLNINLSVQSLAWPTQWAKGKSATASQHQDIFMEYWWPDYADPYSWFINLLYAEKQPYFNLSYYSNPSLDNRSTRWSRWSPPTVGRRSAVQEHAGADPRHRADPVPLQRELPVRDDDQLLRAPGRPGVPERGLRLQPEAA